MFKLVVQMATKEVHVFDHVRALTVSPLAVTVTYWDVQRLTTQMVVWQAAEVESMRSEG